MEVVSGSFLRMTALMADSKDMLQKLVEEFGMVCERRK